jgi:hypothetical protein
MTSEYGILAAFALLVAVAATVYAWTCRCPRCGRWWALYEVGRRDYPGGFTFARSCCRHCRSYSWQRASSGDVTNGEADWVTDLGCDPNNEG